VNHLSSSRWAIVTQASLENRPYGRGVNHHQPQNSHNGVMGEVPVILFLRRSTAYPQQCGDGMMKT
jgi:hypothetical protein